MAIHGCINGAVDGSKFSSPVPVIGLYIAAASLVCTLLMLCDIVAGIRAKKRWLPCKLFALNSVSLTLLSIATKLPADLTTSMPSTLDQLSKLSGTIFICVCMGFLMPSIGNNRDADIFSNLMSLSIFVISIVVNICIQIHTGVIVLFIIEHIIVLCFMVLLLLMFWQIYPSVKKDKSRTTSRYNELVRKGSSSMFGRMKGCYLYIYCCDPQFTISTDIVSAGVGTICLLCLVILIQALIRSFILKRVKYCSGMSDYDWSMPIIVVTQILTVIVGTFPVVFRWLAFFSRMKDDNIPIYGYSPHYRTLEKGVTVYRLYKFCVYLFNSILVILWLLMVFPIELVRYLFPGSYIDDIHFYYLHYPEVPIVASDYIVRKSVDDIIRFREVCCSEPLTNLLQLFRKYPYRPSSDFIHTFEMKFREFIRMKWGMEELPAEFRMEHYPMTLPMVFLVKIAQVSLPGNLLGSLLHAFRLGQEIILFIHQTLRPPKESDNWFAEGLFSIAKDLCRDGDFSGLLPEEYRQRQSGLHLDLIRAREILSKLKESPDLDMYVGFLVGVIIDCILGQTPSTLEDLYTCIEQMFVEMLHWVFRQLPIAIFKSLRESPTEEFEERLRLAIKFLFQIESLKDHHIDWSLPEGSGISQFLTHEAAAAASTEITDPLQWRLKMILQRPAGEWVV